MSRFIIVNGNKYDAKQIDYNTLCDLEDVGVSLSDFNRKKMAFIRGYVTVCMETDKETAGKELEQHIMNGGKFDKIVEVINKEIEESDFFHYMIEERQKKPQDYQKKKQNHQKLQKTGEASE